MLRPAEIAPQKLQSAVRQITVLLVIAALLTGVGIILGALWSDAVMHTYWGWDPRELGGVCVLLWTIFVIAMARSDKASARVVMMFGIFGNIVVTFAWFGPFIFLNGFHGPFTRAQFFAFVVTHVVLLIIGALPATWMRSLSAGLNELRR